MRSKVAREMFEGIFCCVVCLFPRLCGVVTNKACVERAEGEERKNSLLNVLRKTFVSFHGIPLPFLRVEEKQF